MKLMATTKKAVKEAVKAIKKAIEPVAVGSAEWRKMKEEAKARLNNL